MAAIGQKQWDGLILPLRARKCQTGVSTQPVWKKGVRHEAYPRWVDLAKNVFQVHGVDRSEKGRVLPVAAGRARPRAAIRK
jgi:hypothetical protein